MLAPEQLEDHPDPDFDNDRDESSTDHDSDDEDEQLEGSDTRLDFSGTDGYRNIDDDEWDMSNTDEGGFISDRTDLRLETTQPTASRAADNSDDTQERDPNPLVIQPEDNDRPGDVAVAGDVSRTTTERPVRLSRKRRFVDSGEWRCEDCDEGISEGDLLSCNCPGCEMKVCTYCSLTEAKTHLFYSQYHLACRGLLDQPDEWFCDNECTSNAGFRVASSRRKRRRNN